MSIGTDVLGGVTADVGCKAPCAVATTADMTNALIGLPVIDGYQVQPNDRILVWQNNSNQVTNGLYNANTGAWTRTVDFSDSSAASPGTVINVFNGALYGGTQFIFQTLNPTIGTTALVFKVWQLPVPSIPLTALLPSGTIIPFAGPTAPSGFLLCYGQQVSQITFPSLFAALGTTWGSAIGNLFTLPDFRGRVLAGADNMGGTPAGNLSGYVLGNTGGEQTHALITAELAAHSHSITDSGHAHAITDTGHTHSYQVTVIGSAFGTGGTTYADGAATTGSSTTGIVINSATTGIVINNSGSGAAHNNIQPTAAINWIIKT